MKRLLSVAALLLVAASLLALVGCGPSSDQFDITLSKGYTRKRGAETIEGLKAYGTSAYPDDPSLLLFLPMKKIDGLMDMDEEEYLATILTVQPNLFDPVLTVMGESTVGGKPALRAVIRGGIGAKAVVCVSYMVDVGDQTLLFACIDSSGEKLRTMSALDETLGTIQFKE